MLRSSQSSSRRRRANSTGNGSSGEGDGHEAIDWFKDVVPGAFDKSKCEDEEGGSEDVIPLQSQNELVQVKTTLVS